MQLSLCVYVFLTRARVCRSDARPLTTEQRCLEQLQTKHSMYFHMDRKLRAVLQISVTLLAKVLSNVCTYFCTYVMRECFRQGAVERTLYESWSNCSKNMRQLLQVA